MKIHIMKIISDSKSQILKKDYVFEIYSERMDEIRDIFKKYLDFKINPSFSKLYTKIKFKVLNLNAKY